MESGSGTEWWGREWRVEGEAGRVGGRGEGQGRSVEGRWAWLEAWLGGVEESGGRAAGVAEGVAGGWAGWTAVGGAEGEAARWAAGVATEGLAEGGAGRRAP